MKPKKITVDIINNTQIIEDLTDEEILDIENNKIKNQEEKNKEEKRIEDKQNLLNKLGITEEEAKLLLS